MHNGNARSSNVKGTDNVISNGSAIMVEENTCMLTLDNGKITNVVTEPGRYILDNSTAPSIFAGQIKDSLKDLISRFTYGGTPATEQRVIYINLQKLPGIPFGTGTPVPYPDSRYNTTVELRFYGTFEVQIPDAENACIMMWQLRALRLRQVTQDLRMIHIEDLYRCSQMLLWKFLSHILRRL